jgi:hypothetical protein
VTAPAKNDFRLGGLGLVTGENFRRNGTVVRSFFEGWERVLMFGDSELQVEGCECIWEFFSRISYSFSYFWTILDVRR